MILGEVVGPFVSHPENGVVGGTGPVPTQGVKRNFRVFFHFVGVGQVA